MNPPGERCSICGMSGPYCGQCPFSEKMTKKADPPSDSRVTAGAAYLRTKLYPNGGNDSGECLEFARGVLAAADAVDPRYVLAPLLRRLNSAQARRRDS